MLKIVLNDLILFILFLVLLGVVISLANYASRKRHEEQRQQFEKYVETIFKANPQLHKPNTFPQENQ